MKRLLSILLSLMFISGMMCYAAPFPDLPADHWATEAVKVLAEKGLVEGYPNGTFKGGRAATRYEVAMIVARTLAYLEKRPQVSKEDLEAIKRLVNEFKDELDAMGVRLKNVEDLLASLEKRVTELERVKWSGGYETRFTTNLVQTCPGCTSTSITPWQFDGTAAYTRLPLGMLPNSDKYQYDSTSLNNRYPFNGMAGTANRATLDRNAVWDNTDTHLQTREQPDWTIEDYPFDKNYNVYPTRTGSALSQLGYIKVAAKLGEDYTAGGVASFYNVTGQLGNGLIYGVTPDTIANPFQAGMALNGTAGQGFFGTAATNLSANLNQIFVNNDTQKVHAVVGDWRPAFISDHILQGLPNMGVFGPDYLPFYGGQLYGKLGGTVASGLNYEVVAGRLSVYQPVLNSAGNNYQNLIMGGALAYDWKDPKSTLADVRLTGSFVRVINDASANGSAVTQGFDNPGLWASPINTAGFGGTPALLTLSNGSSATVATAVNTGVGPQSENLYGGEVRVKFGKNWNWLTVWGKYGNSRYQVTSGATAPAVPTVTGSMAAGGVVLNPGRVSGGGEYVWVQPQYDPFVAQVPVPTSYFAGPDPAITWFGFPYPVSYGPPYTTYIGSLAFGDALTSQRFANAAGSNTAGGGDVFYNIHDSRKYPSNRTGFRGNLNWDYGNGNVGGRMEYLQQTTISSIASELQPGFYEPIFITLPQTFVNGTALTNPSALSLQNGPARGYILDWTSYANYTVPSKELTIDGTYTDSRIKRFAGDFNNIDLHFISWRGGLTYRPAERWSILAGYDQFASVGSGRYLRPATNTTSATFLIQLAPIGSAPSATIPPGAVVPPNMLFSQTGPYAGVDYAFAKGADGWIMYHVYNMRDNNGTGFAGFTGTELQSGMRFTF